MSWVFLFSCNHKFRECHQLVCRWLHEFLKVFHSLISALSISSNFSACFQHLMIYDLGIQLPQEHFLQRHVLFPTGKSFHSDTESIGWTWKGYRWNIYLTPRISSLILRYQIGCVINNTSLTILKSESTGPTSCPTMLEGWSYMPKANSWKHIPAKTHTYPDI